MGFPRTSASGPNGGRRHHQRRDERPFVQRYLPGLTVLRGYERAWLRGDVLAGVTVAAYLIPQVMAYAEVAGLPAVVGLWASIGPLLVYLFVGSSRELSVGPESTTAIMTATAVMAVAATLPGPLGAERRLDIAAMLALMVGLICVVGGLARLGFLADLLSRPVLIGYLCGIAILMIVSQLGKVTGRSVAGSGVPGQLMDVLTHLGGIHAPTFAVAALSLAALFWFRRVLPSWPGPLIVMLAAAGVVATGWLDGVATIGEVPTGLPVPRVPDMTGIDLAAMLPLALGIAVVGYSDNVLTGRGFASMRDERIDTNQEFLALGVCNLASGVTNGFPVSSSGSRGALGMSMGNHTQVYSLVAVLGILLTMFLLAPVLAAFPLAALGAVVIFAALALIDVPEIRRVARYRLSELAIGAATTTAVLLWDVLTGIGVAVGLSVLDLLRRIADPHDSVLGFTPGVAGMHDVADHPDSTQVEGLVVYRYDSPLFFANADNFLQRAQNALAEGVGPPRWFLLNAEAVVELDLTGHDALEDLRRTLAERGVVLALARVKHEILDELQSGEVLERIGADRVFATLPTAVQAYVRWYEEKYGARPAGAPANG